MLVPQARISKRSVEQIAEFEVVSVFAVDRGAHYDARADGKRCTTCVCVNEQTIFAISGQLSAISDRIVSTGNRVGIVTSDRCCALDGRALPARNHPLVSCRHFGGALLARSVALVFFFFPPQLGTEL